jgi:hypothetical protein
MIKKLVALFYSQPEISDEYLHEHARFDLCDGEPINAAGEELVRRLEQENQR